MAEYYVVRDKNTGLYFRGKGVNRWGKHYNQASIYRIKANAENTIKEVSWRGEQAEVVPIQIIENTAGVVPKSEVEELQAENEELQANVARLRKENTELLISKETDILISMEKLVKVRTEHPIFKAIEEKVAREIFEEIEKAEKEWNSMYSSNYFGYGGGAFGYLQTDVEHTIYELKKKYTEE